MQNKTCANCAHALEEPFGAAKSALRCTAEGHLGTGWIVHQYTKGKKVLVSALKPPAWCKLFKEGPDEKF